MNLILEIVQETIFAYYTRILILFANSMNIYPIYNFIILETNFAVKGFFLYRNMRIIFLSLNLSQNSLSGDEIFVVFSYPLLKAFYLFYNAITTRTTFTLRSKVINTNKSTTTKSRTVNSKIFFAIFNSAGILLNFSLFFWLTFSFFLKF